MGENTFWINFFYEINQKYIQNINHSDCTETDTLSWTILVINDNEIENYYLPPFS